MDLRYIPIFAFGFVGGLIAYLLGAPMPFMMGGIFATASFVLWYERGAARLPKLSRWVRLVSMSMIGTMIGSSFSPDLLQILPQFWLSALALVPFILLAHAGSYAIMRGLGRYSRLDAYFASLPGGIIDSAALAEEAGADLRVVTTQHFIRIIIVVATVPFLFQIVQGEAVGSAAGLTFAAADYDLTDIALIVAIAMVGLVVGRAARLPVSHMLGPLLLALGLSVTGVVDLNVPEWLTHLAQFLVGTALGAQFSGVSRRLLARGLGIGLIVGVYMLTLGASIALLLVPHVPASFPPLFISFAAGGLAEMSLIALSLNFNPVVVALHHLLRILMTVSIGAIIAKRLFPQMRRDKARP
jgi:membrane AbrB-like protein